MGHAAKFAEKRRWMVKYQLRAGGIHDERVLAAMGRVPREAFVPDSELAAAYNDGALPIGRGQTISQPFTVAYMCQAAMLTGSEKVLEVGTGSGYGAAVLSRLVREVDTVERLPELANQARQRLDKLGYRNVRVAVGDGSLGWPQPSLFDAIVVTAGAESLPEALIQQLAPGGRLVIPIGEFRGDQTMYRVTRRDGELRMEDLGVFTFVPLISSCSARAEQPPHHLK
jgi:protein-L-isoaspartate(D-aspartate) O-methyltransferase